MWTVTPIAEKSKKVSCYESWKNDLISSFISFLLGQFAGQRYRMTYCIQYIQKYFSFPWEPTNIVDFLQVYANPDQRVSGQSGCGGSAHPSHRWENAQSNSVFVIKWKLAVKASITYLRFLVFFLYLSSTKATEGQMIAGALIDFPRDFSHSISVVYWAWKNRQLKLFEESRLCTLARRILKCSGKYLQDCFIRLIQLSS